jgi:transposase
MSRFLPYSPDQAYLLPPSVKDELGEDHLSVFLHRVVAPTLMLKVWLYAYALGITSARRLEQRIREDLGLRYLAGGQRPDNWALSAFRRRHGRALNDLFTQVVEMARELGLGRLGLVAIDSTRIRANASRDRIDTEQRLRNERAKIRRHIRRWQKACDASDPDQGAGTRVQVEELERRLAELPRRLERLRKSGGFALGYTAEIAVSEDHLIVAQRVTLNRCDVPALVPLVEEVEQRTGARPENVLADGGFYSNQNVRDLEERGIEVYVPDPNLARELNTGKRARTIGRNRVRSPELKAMRQKLRSPAGRRVYGRRKALVEPVIGVLKQQRGMRQFRTRGRVGVAAEFTLAAIAYNLTRLFTRRLAP